MKKLLSKRVLEYAIAAFLVIACSIIFYFLMLRFDKIIAVVGKILYILKPLIYGIVIAFLLTLAYNFFDKRLSKLLEKRFKSNAKKISKIISITLSILILFISLFLILYILIPKLITSVLGIIETWSANVDNIELWLENILKVSPSLENIILDAVNDSSTSILQWLSTALLPRMENIVSNFTTGLNDMYTFLKDFLIGLVFSIYLLASKNKFIAEFKKIIYLVFGVKASNSILHFCRYSYNVLTGFVKGKLLTSFILGILCYIGMSLMGMPYVLLICLICVVTNIIPYFGPLIGWVPSVILIAMVDPMKALYFTIMTIILQQIEGNIIEPKIVGNTTGISGFWVLFSIVIFGELFGFVGMIIGVPIFAIIYHFVSLYINKFLMKKNLPTDNDEYLDLKYIDEDTMEAVKK